MKRFIFCALFFSTTICYGQTSEQQQWLLRIFNTKRIDVTKKFNKDTILVAPVYWELLATYDGKTIVPQDELANRIYKFTADGKFRIVDDMMRTRFDAVRGTWDFNAKINSLTLHFGNQEKTYKVIVLNQVEMLLDDPGYARFYLTAKAKYEPISEDMRRRFMLEL